MFKWFEKIWDEWLSLEDIELLDDVYMQANKLHPEEEEE